MVGGELTLSYDDDMHDLEIQSCSVSFCFQHVTTGTATGKATVIATTTRTRSTTTSTSRRKRRPK